MEQGSLPSIDPGGRVTRGLSRLWIIRAPTAKIIKEDALEEEAK